MTCSEFTESSATIGSVRFSKRDNKLHLCDFIVSTQIKAEQSPQRFSVGNCDVSSVKIQHENRTRNR